MSPTPNEEEALSSEINVNLTSLFWGWNITPHPTPKTLINSKTLLRSCLWGCLSQGSALLLCPVCAPLGYFLDNLGSALSLNFPHLKMITVCLLGQLG